MSSHATLLPTPLRLVVWTVLRAGAVPLVAGLHARAGLPAQPARSLAPGGSQGATTLHWLRRHDAATLQAGVASLCAQPGVIVHPLDAVPWPVTAALLAHSTAAGYVHLFWYPQDAAARMQGLQAALGAEAPERARLVEHTQGGEVRLQTVWDALVAAGTQPLALTVEAVCQAKPADAVAALRPVLARLGLPAATAADKAWAARVQAAQPVAGDGAAVGVAHFAPASVWRALRVTALPLPPSCDVMHAVIDTWPQAFGPTDLTRLGGVVVTRSDAAPAQLVAQDGQGRPLPPVTWRLPSPRMRTRFADSGNADAARFFWRMAGPPAQVRLLLLPGGDASPVPLFDCHWQPATLADVALWLAAQADAPDPLALAALRRTLDGLPRDAGWAEADATWQALRVRAAPFLTATETPHV
ncbi:MAG: hypothetical protein LCH73_00305 [Proteobacteria bacterium]|nr:hypothetical protein [Pseudomonadota bacterium]